MQLLEKLIKFTQFTSQMYRPEVGSRMDPPSKGFHRLYAILLNDKNVYDKQTNVFHIKSLLSCFSMVVPMAALVITTAW